MALASIGADDPDGFQRARGGCLALDRRAAWSYSRCTALRRLSASRWTLLRLSYTCFDRAHGSDHDARSILVRRHDDHTAEPKEALDKGLLVSQVAHPPHVHVSDGLPQDAVLILDPVAGDRVLPVAKGKPDEEAASQRDDDDGEGCRGNHLFQAGLLHRVPDDGPEHRCADNPQRGHRCGPHEGECRFTAFEQHFGIDDGPTTLRRATHRFGRRRPSCPRCLQVLAAGPAFHGPGVDRFSAVRTLRLFFVGHSRPFLPAWPVAVRRSGCVFPLSHGYGATATAGAEQPQPAVRPPPQRALRFSSRCLTSALC